MRISFPSKLSLLFLCLPALLAADPTDNHWADSGGGAEQASVVERLQRQLDEQALLLEDLRNRLNKHEQFDSALEPGECNSTCCSKVQRTPLVVEQTVAPCGRASDDEFRKLSFYADYSDGFSILPFDREQTPFSLRVNGWIQFRHHGFARDVDRWTDNAGVVRPIRNRNALDIERARLYFKGTAVDQRLTYFYHLDGDTDGGHAVDFFDYWWAWDFSDSFRLQIGKRKVPASRQWLLGARRTRFVDRPMSNDFFRPDRTIGIYGLGRIGKHGRYEVMVGNGYRTGNLANSRTDDQLTYAATCYLDPLGEFGSQLADYDWTCDSRMRLGHSFVYAPMSADELGSPLDETDFLRLSDGTRLNQTGALFANATVSEVDLYFYGVDFAWKYRGWSFSTEVFFRWLTQLRADLDLPHRDLFQRGYYLEGGKFLIPQKLDANLRYSEVNGLFGRSSEYSAGANFYPLDSFRVKLSFDVTVLDGSPLHNTASDILVGDDGILFRSQVQAEF